MGESVPSTFQNLKLMSAEVTAKVARFVNDSLAENTRKAYLSDLSEFERWGGSIPASAETVAAYMAARADTLAVASIVRHVASISKAHEARGLPNPTRSELVRATMRGIKRTRGCAQREAKPLLRDDLLLVLDAMGDGLKDIRDRALLLIGFAGALRRSVRSAPGSRRNSGSTIRNCVSRGKRGRAAPTLRGIEGITSFDVGGSASHRTKSNRRFRNNIFHELHSFSVSLNNIVSKETGASSLTSPST
jgi:hypothetical protein